MVLHIIMVLEQVWRCRQGIILSLNEELGAGDGARHGSDHGVVLSMAWSQRVQAPLLPPPIPTAEVGLGGAPSLPQFPHQLLLDPQALCTAAPLSQTHDHELLFYAAERTCQSGFFFLWPYSTKKCEWKENDMKRHFYHLCYRHRFILNPNPTWNASDSQGQKCKYSE